MTKDNIAWIKIVFTYYYFDVKNIYNFLFMEAAKLMVYGWLQNISNRYFK